MQSDQIKRVENEFVKFWLKDGIMYGEYKSNIVVNLEAAKKVAYDRIQLSENQSLPCLVFISKLDSMTKDARDYFSKGEGIDCITKLALITNSPVARVMSNFYLQINKPLIPTRLFANTDDAEKWLKEEEDKS